MNRLHNALSPYLLQHSENPVHWQPWDDAAFAQAAREKKPILLSIGYAACHWCHVMAHESFADADTAALMNAHFVNIKVDREERPDIDRIYQSAHYLFTRHNGGWPLTMFLTPQGEPFFGGTYFPKTARPGLPSFTEVLTRVTAVWQRQQDAVKAQNAHILPLLKTLDDYQPAEGSLTDVALHAAAKKFEQLFDAKNGGLGGAPKFPHPVELDFCLHYATMHNRPALVKKVHRALQTMANSGLCDQLGGGFFRYCTDAAWSIPHFEKMLYDNGLLLALYAQAGAVLDDEQLQNTAAITANWALRAMRTEQGVFYASQDADSVEGEGAFYLWSEPELQQILTAEEYKMVAVHYGINSAAPRVEGRLHLMRQHTVAETAAITQTTSVYCAEQLAVAGEKLLRQRQTRPIPPIDDKILTAWNALMCRGLAVSGRLQQNAEWLNAAKCGINHLYEQMRKNGRTLAVCRGTRYGEKGFLDDVAFLLDAILELLRADFSAPLFTAAGSLAEELCTHYYDEAQGGFFFTPHDDEALIRRLKISDDNATPSGNGVACRALLLLYQLSGDIRWRAAAEKTLLRFKDIVHKQPTAHASLASALQYYLTPPTLVYLTGEAALCRQWQQALEKNADAGVVVFYQPPSIRTDPRLPAQMIKKAPQVGAYAYLCDDKQCSAPLTTLAEVQQRLAE